MKTERISTQTLLEVLLQEMEHVKAYTNLVKKIGPSLDGHLAKIRNEKIEMNTDKLEQIYKSFHDSAKKQTTIPTWFLIVAAFAFVAAIVEGLVLYYLVFK